MAGIGFVLRKLYSQDNLSGLMRACLHSAFASAGPWLFTVLALGLMAVLGIHLVTLDVLFDFRVILIYNFSFSLVFSGPIFMIATRYLSDGIYRHDVSDAPGMLFGTLSLLWAIELMFVVPFYFLVVKLSPLMALSAIINFILLSTVWLISVFISAMKNYRLITLSFLGGMTTALLLSLLLARTLGAVGFLNSFSIGICVVIALLLGNIFVEYPYPIQKPYAVIKYFSRYWELAIGGMVYNMAIWADKWIMWFTPEATHLSSNLVIYPNYDSTMFIAYLTTVPSMALFLFSAETNFFEHYRRFYRDIEQKATFTKITKNHKAIVLSIFGSTGRFFFLQGSIAFLGALLAPEIIKFLQGSYLQIGMLRYGLFGAFFQILTLFLLVLLSYFDNRRAVLFIQSVFLVTNSLFTILSCRAGFSYYGFGYFLSTFVTFIVAAWIVRAYVLQLPFHTFISTNASVTTRPH